MNTIPRLQPPSPHLHEPFLKRAADPGEGTSGAHALGGFLAMRLVDQFAADRRPPAPEALAYQVRATRDFLCDLHSQEIETQHLLNLVHTAEHARHADAGRLLWAPVLAFAYWLESQLRLEEAMDVLDTALRLGSGDAPLEEQIATHLQRGRVLREVGRFEESREDYVRAGSLAHRAGDGRSERRSRVGRALIFQAVGNLPEAERMLRAVLEDARAAGDRVAEAHAKHDLANTLELMGRPEDGIPLAFNAYQLYEEPLQRFRALSDLGILFKDLGNHEAAQDAFMLVIEGEPPPEIRLTTVSELIEIAGLRGDRLAFERWRREAAATPAGSPYLGVDLELKLGGAYARLGYPDRAREHLRAAIDEAEARRLNQLAFRAEAALADLDRQAASTPRRKAPTPRAVDADVDSVAERLAALRLTYAER